MGRIRVLNLAGSYYEMGKAHGERFRDEIHMFTEDRVGLSRDVHWTGRAPGYAAPDGHAHCGDGKRWACVRAKNRSEKGI